MVTQVSQSADQVRALAEEAHKKFAANADGANASYIPYLASVPSDLFGIAVAFPDGTVVGILAVVPGKLTIGAFSPPLDEAGNGVRGQLAAAYIN